MCCFIIRESYDDYLGFEGVFVTIAHTDILLNQSYGKQYLKSLCNREKSNPDVKKVSLSQLGLLFIRAFYILYSRIMALAKLYAVVGQDFQVNSTSFQNWI